MPTARLVDLDDPLLAQLCARARDAGEDIPAALQIAAHAGALMPQPGTGDTLRRWNVLAELARANVTVARVVEAHADALAILAEAALPDQGGTWGVFAAEMPDTRLTAAGSGDEFLLDGVKPWCSLGGVLDHALVTAHVPDGRRLFRVALRQPGVEAAPITSWAARGLRTVTSGPVTFRGVPARPVGDEGWYLRRDGFAWGGMGVAACWHGAAAGLADAVLAASRKRTGDLAALHVGVIDAALFGSAAALRGAAASVDAGEANGEAGELLALRLRAVVADAVERVLRQAGHALGPAPLAFDAEHAARVADLELYVRQHHGERDLAALGTALGVGGS